MLTKLTEPGNPPLYLSTLAHGIIRCYCRQRNRARIEQYGAITGNESPAVYLRENGISSVLMRHILPPTERMR